MHAWALQKQLRVKLKETIPSVNPQPWFYLYFCSLTFMYNCNTKSSRGLQKSRVAVTDIAASARVTATFMQRNPASVMHLRGKKHLSRHCHLLVLATSDCNISYNWEIPKFLKFLNSSLVRELERISKVFKSSAALCHIDPPVTYPEINAA